MITIEGVPEHSVEDGGAAIILTLYNEKVSDDGSVFYLNPFVRIQSYDEGQDHHQDIEPLIGKRLRVTIQEVDESFDITKDNAYQWPC